MKRIAAGKEPPWEIAQVLRGFSLPHMDEPPFVVEWMFGIRDVPWLTELRSQLTQTYADATLELEPTDWEGRDRALAELLPEYQRILVDVARSRWRADPDLGAYCADGRLLKDIPADSNEHRWLKAVLDRVGPHILWVQQEWTRGREFPLEYLAATDLPSLVRLRRDGFAAVAQTTAGTTAEEVARLVRPHAEAFYYGIVKPRIPE